MPIKRFLKSLKQGEGNENIAQKHIITHIGHDLGLVGALVICSS